MDTNAFKQNFLPCSKKLYLIACRLLRNSDDAEDMVQEAYIRLWKKRDELDDVTNYEAYAVTTLKHICLDFLQSKHETTCEVTDAEENIASDSSLTDYIESNEELNLVIKIMEHLPPQQKMVMQLRHFDECSMEEIEQATGLSNINIRTLLSRARKKVRELYKMSYD
ncbi:MAG: sigma-70 family RNA polymerase sigma factor [Muribaculaceae bacterium]